MKPLRPDDPRRVGGYRVLGLLGAGGMGRVYAGRSQGGRVVAIKVVRPELADDPNFRARFRREVDAARRVGGAWTAPVLDADLDADQPWLVTGYVPGPSLFDAVDARGPLPTSSLHVLGAGLAQALVAVHGAGLVHRDLKPSNVLLALDGPKVIDFGISHAIDETVLTRTGVVIGSPAFMPPEQIEGHAVSPASDVFSLGAVLVYAGSGTGPFGTGSLQTLMFRILTQQPDLGELPVSLTPVVARCLAKAPADRPTPAEVVAELAPRGGPVMVSDGWLPADLTASLSRRAVELLDLDLGPDVGVEPGPGPGPGLGLGLDPGSDPTSHPDGVASRAGNNWAPANLVASDPSVSRAQPRPAPRPARRLGSRGVSPPIVVGAVVAVVLLVGAVAAGFALGGHDSSGRAAGPATNVMVSPVLPTPVTQWSGGASADGTPPTTLAGQRSGVVVAGNLPAGKGPLPDQYVGTWTGTATTQNLGLPQDVVLTLRPGANGDVVGSSTFTIPGLEQLSCGGDASLAGADGRGVLLLDVPGSGSGATIGGEPLCTSGGQYLLEPQPTGELRLTMLQPEAGNPTGTLRRSP